MWTHYTMKMYLTILTTVNAKQMFLPRDHIFFCTRTKKNLNSSCTREKLRRNTGCGHRKASKKE